MGMKICAGILLPEFHRDSRERSASLPLLQSQAKAKPATGGGRGAESRLFRLALDYFLNLLFIKLSILQI